MPRRNKNHLRRNPKRDRRSKYAKDLRTPKYKMRVVKDKRNSYKRKKVNIQDAEEENTEEQRNNDSSEHG